MNKDADGTVYVLLYRDVSPTAVISVFASLQDANAECLRLAAEACVSVENTSPTAGPDRGHLLPLEPLRWDTADGASCWVEQHVLQPKRVISPPPERWSQHFPARLGSPLHHKEDSDLDHRGPGFNDIVVDKKFFSRGAAQAGDAVRS
ncbi:hypothetical protein HJFPF1_04614 [Paramyrothecium foliicola]|nr:hypothetical protein HJFPF1_04614 [Paramyrothecium foliicola]